MYPLIKGKLTKKLFVYSFMHSDESYYVRELAGLIGVDPGNLSRELAKLETEGIFNSSKKGGLKFYSLNKKYPSFRELKELISKSIGIEAKLKELILQYKDITITFIYGSYAKNEDKKDSDIDLIIVGSLPQAEFTRSIRNIENELNREINFTLYSKQEFDKEKNKTGGFLNLVLKNKIILLKGKLNAE